MTTQQIIYKGDRSSSFKNFIKNILEKSKLKSKYINELISDHNMKYYDQAFTAASANPINNYEIFEQIGDLSANKFIVSYAYNRFPQLECPAGVKVVARLRINYGSRQSFSKIGEQLGFWDFISADEEDRMRSKKDLIEDCVEAFIGCTEQVLDKTFRPGVGYAIVYDILASIFNKIDISLHYNDLYDAKTRLKELFDLYKDHLGNLHYIDSRDDLAESIAYQIPYGTNIKPIINRIQEPNTAITKYRTQEEPNTGWIRLGSGKAARKNDAQQKAAEEGLKKLNILGWVKEIPDEYKFFCE